MSVPTTTPGAAADRAAAAGPSRRAVIFVVTFLAAWWLLDALATAPPTPISAVSALAAAAAALVVGQRATGTGWTRVPASLGLGPPEIRVVAVAGLAGGVYCAVLLLGARGLGITLVARENWPTALVGVLVFHGLAEELVWRGYVFARLRAHCTFTAAVWWSVPLIALTHSPMLVTDGWLVGGLATFTAAITCWPLSYLWERGGRTVWAPALLHGLVGTWQLFERSYPPTFSALVLAASIAVPLLALVPELRRPRSVAPRTPTPT